MTWQEKRKWFLYGVPDGPYVIEKSIKGYDCWLLGHRYVGFKKTLRGARLLCEHDLKEVRGKRDE